MSDGDLRKYAAQIEAGSDYRRPAAFALGLARLGHDGPDAPVLDTWYPRVNHDEHHITAALFADLLGHHQGSASYRLGPAQLNDALERFGPWLAEAHRHPNIHALQMLAQSASEAVRPPRSPQVVVCCFIGDLQDAPVDAHDAYLRLHLLSHRRIRPHGCSLTGLFGLLHNVAWTDHGPIDAAKVDGVRLSLRAQGEELHVHAIDKFPRMCDYVVPSGVRIGDADRVRLGAHLAEGTTIMHEGFVNFNAGTLGHSMVEGRISAGVVVGDGSDLGGGASIMGTLSGGGSEVISVGRNCLIGANAGLGISLGDGCTVESGLYLTAGAKVSLPDGSVVKARELSGRDGLLFWRNSQNGRVEVRYQDNAVTLNQDLHKN